MQHYESKPEKSPNSSCFSSKDQHRESLREEYCYRTKRNLKSCTCNRKKSLGVHVSGPPILPMLFLQGGLTNTVIFKNLTLVCFFLLLWRRKMEKWQPSWSSAGGLRVFFHTRLPRTEMISLHPSWAPPTDSPPGHPHRTHLWQRTLPRARGEAEPRRNAPCR